MLKVVTLKDLKIFRWKCGMAILTYKLYSLSYFICGCNDFVLLLGAVHDCFEEPRLGLGEENGRSLMFGKGNRNEN